MKEVRLKHNNQEYTLLYEVLHTTDGTKKYTEHRLYFGRKEIKAGTLEKAVEAFKRLTERR